MVSNPHRWLLPLLYLAGFVALAVFAQQGWGYYSTPLVERPRHPLYWTFKPGGTHGLRFGIVGATMMTLMLGYPLRKRWSSLRHAGSLRLWLDYHILLGILGPLFIVLHSSFKVGGLVGLSFWSMVAVALSGVLGRWLYQQIPRGHSGDALSLSEAEAESEALSRQLVERFGLPGEAVVELDVEIASGIDTDRPLVLLLLASPLDTLSMRRRLRRFRKRHGGLEPGLRRQLEAVVARKSRLRRRLLLWNQLHRVFHYWHVLHRPFAIVMYLFMVLHIGVAWWTGYV